MPDVAVQFPAPTHSAHALSALHDCVPVCAYPPSSSTEHVRVVPAVHGDPTPPLTHAESNAADSHSDKRPIILFTEASYLVWAKRHTAHCVSRRSVTRGEAVHRACRYAIACAAAVFRGNGPIAAPMHLKARLNTCRFQASLEALVGQSAFRRGYSSVGGSEAQCSFELIDRVTFAIQPDAASETSTSWQTLSAGSASDMRIEDRSSHDQAN